MLPHVRIEGLVHVCDAKRVRDRGHTRCNILYHRLAAPGSGVPFARLTQDAAQCLFCLTRGIR